MIEQSGKRIFADLNSVEIHRNRISLGGRQPENERRYSFCFASLINHEEHELTGFQGLMNNIMKMCMCMLIAVVFQVFGNVISHGGFQHFPKLPFRLPA
jgi:hypothetical protein